MKLKQLRHRWRQQFDPSAAKLSRSYTKRGPGRSEHITT